MDWTDKLEHNKKIRKMAYRMLWADVRNIVLSWKVLLIILMYVGFLLLPYVKKEGDWNFAGTLYLVTMAFIGINALPETVFNYLPLSTKDIVYYLKIRTNHLEAWLVFFSGVTAIIMDACGTDVFWERGVIVLLFLLVLVEWMFFMTLYDCSKPKGVSILDDNIPTGRKIRIAAYNIYSFCLLIACMWIGMFMDYNENAKIKAMVILCLYLVLYIFRADATRWVRFNEFCETQNRSMLGNQQRTNQK